MRTLWLRSISHYNDVIAAVASVGLGFKVAITILEAIEKRSILKPEFGAYPPEATAGLYSRSLFWWMNPIFKLGFSKALSVEDLFVLDKNLSSEKLLAAFEEQWNNGKNDIRTASVLPTNSDQ